MLYELSPGEELSVSYKNGSVSTIKQDVAQYVSRLEEWYPDESVRSKGVEATPGVKFDVDYRDVVNHTIGVLPFCVLADSTYSNSHLSGRVVIPPYVDVEGERYTVTGIQAADPHWTFWNENLTELVLPTTVRDIQMHAVYGCTAISSVSLPGVDNIDVAAFCMCSSLQSVQAPAVTCLNEAAFGACDSLTSVEFPSATVISSYALDICSALQHVFLPAAEVIGENVFSYGDSLELVDFGDKLTSVPTLLSSNAFEDVPTTCKIIVPDKQYDDWIAAPEWSDLVTRGYQFLRHSEWEYARKYEVDKKADKPVSFTTGNLAEFNSNGNPTDSGKSFEDIQDQIDTESPLLARSYAVPQQSGWAINQVSSSSSIYFRPRYFGMKNGDLFKGIVLRTRNTGRIPAGKGVYMRLKRHSDGQMLGASELTLWPDTANTDVVFRFPRAVELTSSGNYYMLDFSETPAGSAVNFGMSLYSLPSGTSSPDFYFASQTNVPIATAQFYSWEELTGADIAVSGADAKKINTALAEKVDKTTLAQALEPFKDLVYDDGYDVDIDTVVSALVQLANLT